MNINKSLSDKALVTPKGKAHWVKVNTRYDEYEGKRKYKISVSFDDKAVEAKFKKVCDDLLAQAKSMPEFNGKKWSADAGCGYKEQEDGTLYFNFQTTAFFTDRNTGEEIQKIIPCLDTVKRKKLDKDIAIGDGSEVRISFSPGAYWSSSKSNGINLYLSKIAVDKLIEFSGGDNFDEFGVSLADDAEEFADMESDEEIPV